MLEGGFGDWRDREEKRINFLGEREQIDRKWVSVLISNLKISSGNELSSHSLT